MKCKPGCTCGRHSVKKCSPNCTCGKHDSERRSEQNRIFWSSPSSGFNSEERRQKLKAALRGHHRGVPTEGHEDGGYFYQCD